MTQNISIIATPGEAASQILKDLQQQLQHQHNVNIRSRQQSQESQATPRAYKRNQNMVILCQPLFPVYYLQSLIYSQNIYGLVSIKTGYSCSRHSEGSSTRAYNTPSTYNFITVFIIVVEGNSRETSFRRKKICNATWS